MSSTRQPGAEGAEERRGGAFYDESEVFERYRRHRQWPLNPNMIMEEPALFDELGCVSGLRVLDLGCGDAAVGQMLLDAGCMSYMGIDGSEKMTRAAQATLTDSVGEAVLCDIEEFSAPPASFDLVVSRMALHYVKDLGRVLRVCHACLAPGGRIVFTVVHPVITSHDARRSTAEPRGDWVVDDYFVAGPREREWLGARSVWHHRTIEDYVYELRRAGFELTNLRECAPLRERFDDEAEFERRRRIPLILLLAGSPSTGQGVSRSVHQG
jgi:SAM-dependent methyltransferase